MRLAAITLIALKIVLLFAFAYHIRFVMDEFLQLGYAKHLGNGMFETLWPPKAIGFAIFYKLAHLIGWDATSILLAGRVQTALLACGTLALAYGCARALGNDRLRSLAIILVLLSFSNFMERIFRTIAEPLAVFFAAAALMVLLRGRVDNAKTVVAAGALVGLSFLATQKALYFDVALGVALVADAALAGRYRDGVVRGFWLVLGWLIPIAAYCLIFGGANPAAVASNLVFGPVEVATTGADAYTNLRNYVWQTLQRNALLYLFCFAGIALAWTRIASLDERARIALIFTSIVTALVFAHNQPWPYVFIMALPFMALWSLEPLDRLAGNRRYQALAWLALGVAVAASFARNLTYLQIDNRDQLDLVARAERLVGRDEVYFDGIAMLPNRSEPSTLWLDRGTIVKTLREGQASEAYRILSTNPPKLIIWSYRMDAIEPLVGDLIRKSYVRISPNIWIAGRRLKAGEPTAFDVPVAGHYRLYSEAGTPSVGRIETDNKLVAPPVRLEAGEKIVTLRTGAAETLLLPEGNYAGIVKPGPDNRELFKDVYD